MVVILILIIMENCAPQVRRARICTPNTWVSARPILTWISALLTVAPHFLPNPYDPFSEPLSPGKWSWKLALCSGLSPSAKFPEKLPSTSLPSLFLPVPPPLLSLNPQFPDLQFFLSSLCLSPPQRCTLLKPSSELTSLSSVACKHHKQSSIPEKTLSLATLTHFKSCLHFISRGVVATRVQPTDKKTESICEGNL